MAISHLLDGGFVSYEAAAANPDATHALLREALAYGTDMLDD